MKNATFEAAERNLRRNKMAASGLGQLSAVLVELAVLTVLLLTLPVAPAGPLYGVAVGLAVLLAASSTVRVGIVVHRLYRIYKA